MQQTSLLLDINDLPPIETIEHVDRKQLRAFIEVCRASDRPDLAAPYAAYLCEESRYDERRSKIWFDAISEDDIFLVKAIISSGFDVNETYEYRNEDNEEEFGSAITDALAYKSEKVLSFLLEQPELDIDIVGYTISDYERPTLANPFPANDYVVPFLRLRRSAFAFHLERLKFDIDIRWGRSDDRTALMVAIEKNDFELAEWLLKHKSDPNQLLEDSDYASLFGWQVHDYLQEPASDKLKLIKLMLEHGASTLANDWENIPVYLIVWQSKDQELINLFQLDFLQEEWESKECTIAALQEQISAVHKIEELKNHAKHAEHIRNEDSTTSPTLDVSILTELRVLTKFHPGSWVSDVRIKQVNDELRIIVCQDESSPLNMVEVTIPDELAYYDQPCYTSCSCTEP
ncbi:MULTISPECIES: ankyrin repeat domain-containing protein [Aeromonas]|uniref:ankyrin repeat domain-containing protein n=1 Tax=Aeromonas TaxID=642 RepID=UPI0022E62D9C|nr:ankyrin repeat domain-containing protein [Aeromonas sp. QDB13]